MESLKQVTIAYMQFENAISRALQDIKTMSKEQISKELTKHISEELAGETAWQVIVCLDLLIKKNFQIETKEERNTIKKGLAEFIEILLPLCNPTPPEVKKVFIDSQKVSRFLE